MKRHDLRRVNDRTRQPALHRVVHINGIQHMAGSGIEAEGNIGKSQNNLNVREFGRQLLDRLQRPKPKLPIILVTGADGEGQRIDHQVAARQAILVTGELDQPPRDPKLALTVLGHAVFIDRERDDGRPESPRQRQPCGRRPLAVFEIDRVDHPLAAIERKRGFQHRQLRRVENQRRIGGTPKPADDSGHIRDLVPADIGGTDIEGV